MTAAAMPSGNAPSVAKDNKHAAIDWVGNNVAAGVRVESYIVTRFGAGDPVVVCDRVTATACKDKVVPNGTWTWKVQPVFKSWIGDYSPSSLPLTFSGPPPTVAQLASAISRAAPSSAPTVTTSAPAGGGVVVTSPPAVVSTPKSPAPADPEEEPDTPAPPMAESAPAEPSSSVSPAEDSK
jgi:hypothetical protein